MAKIVEITSLREVGLEIFAKLTEQQLRNKLEPEKGIFIAESDKVICTSLEKGCTPVAFLMERKYITGKGASILARCPEVPVYTGEREVLAELTGYQLTRGILGAFVRPKLPNIAALLKTAQKVAVLEGITDATNVGAIFRSAAALNVDAVLLTPTSCDPFARRSMRVSMGSVLQVPWAYLPQGDLLKTAGFTTVALALSDNALSLKDERLRRLEKLALIFGTEGTGLSPQSLAACDYVVKIPMSHGVDSLNVAAASAVVFWQLC